MLRFLRLCGNHWTLRRHFVVNNVPLRILFYARVHPDWMIRVTWVGHDLDNNVSIFAHLVTWKIIITINNETKSNN